MPTIGFTLEAWLAMAQHSARVRGLPEIEPLLAGLVPALRTVRQAHGALSDSATHTKPSEPEKP